MYICVCELTCVSPVHLSSLTTYQNITKPWLIRNMVAIAEREIKWNLFESSHVMESHASPTWASPGPQSGGWRPPSTASGHAPCWRSGTCLRCRPTLPAGPPLLPAGSSRPPEPEGGWDDTQQGSDQREADHNWFNQSCHGKVISRICSCFIDLAA